jgi:hypothetical protein
MKELKSVTIRAVAQLVSVHVWGTWGRRFKSGQPEYFSFCCKQLRDLQNHAVE